MGLGQGLAAASAPEVERVRMGAWAAQGLGADSTPGPASLEGAVETGTGSERGRVEVAVAAAQRAIVSLRQRLAVAEVKASGVGAAWAGGEAWGSALSAGPWSSEMARWASIKESTPDAT